MAIPPIIANSPVLKLFSATKDSGTANIKTQSTAQSTKDIVDISEAAQKRLDGARNLKSEGENAARAVAQDTAALLNDNETLSLGADPAFDQS
jgi:hypothetical protein